MKTFILKGKEFYFDDEDFDIITNRFQSLSVSNGYINAYFQDKCVGLHRFIVENANNLILGDLEVDHKDGNPQNNQKSNLRICTRAQNSRNTKKRRGEKYGTNTYKGVSVNPSGSYSVRIVFNGKEYHIGCFENEKDGAIAYDIKAREFFGEFARCNFDSTSQEEIGRIIDIMNNPKKYSGLSRFKGVCPFVGKWKATITINFKSTHLGMFENEVDAAICYDIYAKRFRGIKAKVNFDFINKDDEARVLSQMQNPKKHVGTSKYLGVSRVKRDFFWSAQIGVKGKKVYLGTFPSQEDAAKAYNEAAIKLKGDKAKLNKINV